ncbi:MAG: glucosaminidase domain-containing protein [Magnetovibrio sp.]|nr:glucosaminidase domain-containing protein [Magnetovibrio sp.]
MVRIAPLLVLVLVLTTIILSWKAFHPAALTLADQVEIATSVLKRARTDRSVVYDPALNWSILPKVKNSRQRKVLFLAKFLPLIAEQNERILLQRHTAETVPMGSAEYNALTNSYRLNSGASRKALLDRVDRIPESLALAQAAIESGWGTSRFAQLGHAYFGERTYDKSIPGMAPLKAKGFTVKKFNSTAASIRSFMLTINSHRAYKGFRRQRAKLRLQNRLASGQELAPYLQAYSEIGSAYTDRILITIKANRLDDFDGIQHVDH